MTVVTLKESRQYTISHHTNYHVELKAHYGDDKLPTKFSVSRFINDNLVNRTEFHGNDLTGANNDFESLRAEAFAKADEYDHDANAFLQRVEEYRLAGALK